MRTLAYLAITSWLAGLAAAQAQPAGCSAEPSANASQTLRCGGVTLVVEAGADFVVLDRNRDGQIDAVELRSKAVLVDVPKQRKGGSRFEVITPQAIAAVRGTQWAVDAEAARTSVFVVGGRVGVRRRGGPGRVVLGAGEGVDVEPGRAPLTVRQWPQPRVAALLARLGR